MIECVPNFSEGRDAAKVRAIAESIAAIERVRLLGWELDPDHHRSVITFVGEPDDVVRAAVRGVGKAAELINLHQHQGVHPRVGAADVVPFIPLDGSTIKDCVTAAHQAGAEIWSRFGIPVYFYEHAALRPERRPLQHTRRPGFDGRPPDIGAIAAHATAGAVMVGARGFLIAFNARLKTADVAAARAIASKIRESSGGLKGVKAIGLYLTSQGRAQVSMNLIDADLDAVYSAISAVAEIEAWELIGYVPRSIYDRFPAFFHRAENFTPARIL